MKYYHYFLGLTAAVVVFCSCDSKNEEAEHIENNGLVKMSITVGSENTAESTTRTYVRNVDNSNTDIDPVVRWHDYDHLAIYGANRTKPSDFSCTEVSTDGKIATFNGEIAPLSEGEYYFLYPYQEGLSWSNGFVRATIPHVQGAYNGNFDEKAAFMASAHNSLTPNTNISLKHVCAYLKITLDNGVEAEKITVSAVPKSNDPYYLAGKVDLSIHSNGTSVNSFIEGQTSVELKNPNGAAYPIGAGTYLIAIVPATSYPPLHVEVTLAGGQGTISGDVSNTQINAGTIYNLGTIRTTTPRDQ